jgi:non-specific serine/threonine protein kinase
LGGVLDVTARRAYTSRLDELRDELEEAQRFNDVGRVAKAQEELDFLHRELAAATGLHGRDRPLASTAERARLSVTKAVKAVLRKTERAHPALAHHLRGCIRTGTYCSYQPDPAQPRSWIV